MNSRCQVRLVLALTPLLALAPRAPARAEGPPAGTSALRELNAATARLVERAAPAVVQVLVSGYGPIGGGGPVGASLVTRQHGLGSGVIVDPEGWVLTNAHVVRGAQRIVVVLPPAANGPARGAAAKGRSYDARVVGSDRLIDLALLKIAGTGLPVLPLDAASRVRQGELVFAIGSPEGLDATVTMGVVSAAARQADFEAPMTFIQTDAPINPGNSGGALIDVEGRLVGINTFILSESGGNQGLGFAIPAATARFAYDSLRRFGRVRRLEAGVAAQAITPALAGGLGLPRDWGVLVADVSLDGPARAAGLRAGDVVDAVDGRPIGSLAALTESIYLHDVATPLRVDVLRGEQRIPILIQGVEAKDPANALADLANPKQHLVRKLGILGLAVSDKLAGLVKLRNGVGVIVAARTLDTTSVEAGLEVGDVIHEVNGKPVDSVEGLRAAIAALKPGDPLVLRIERQESYHFLATEME